MAKYILTPEQRERKRQYEHERYLKHREEILARHKRWREDNKEYAAQLTREWREKNKEKVQAYSRNCYLRHLDKYRQAHRRYYYDNYETETERHKQWAKDNRERKNQNQRERYFTRKLHDTDGNFRAKINEYGRKNRERNGDVYNARRRLKRKIESEICARERVVEEKRSNGSL